MWIQRASFEAKTDVVELRRGLTIVGSAAILTIAAGTLAVEILNVSPHGFWVLVRAREYFLDYDHFPWFRRARLDQLFRVELLHEQHLFWPELDVDLAVECIDEPKSFPLITTI